MDSVVGSVRAIARAEGAVLVNCAAGKDRTELALAVALDAAAGDRATVVGDYLATRERIDAILARLGAWLTYRAELAAISAQKLAPVARTVQRVLELVDERFGGSVPGLSAHGLDDADAERLRRWLAPVRPARVP